MNFCGSPSVCYINSIKFAPFCFIVFHYFYFKLFYFPYRSRQIIDEEVDFVKISINYYIGLFSFHGTNADMNHFIIFYAPLVKYFILTSCVEKLVYTIKINPNIFSISRTIFLLS